MKALVDLMRVKSWVKNGFLFLPLVFSLNLMHISLVVQSLLAFVVFSLSCSFIYIINDRADAEKDALHLERKIGPSLRVVFPKTKRY